MCAVSVKANESKHDATNVINILCSHFNRDLSFNKIQLIEECAFETFCFLKLIELQKFLSSVFSEVCLHLEPFLC